MKKSRFLRVFSLILSIIMLSSVMMLAVGCVGTPTPPEGPEEPEDPETPTGPVVIVKDNATDYTIAYDDAFSDAANDLRRHIVIEYGVEAIEKYEFRSKTASKELLLGATNRKISKDLKAAVDAKSTNANDLVWGYAHKDGKIAFYANCEYAIDCGWGAFIDAISADGEMSCDSDLWVIGVKDRDEYLVENGLFFKDKTISFMGDSITSFKGHIYEGNLYAYPMNFLSNYKDTYWYKIADAYGMNIGVNDGWSGARIGWNGKDEVYAGGLMVNADAVMSSQNRIDRLDDNGDPDYIVVYAGTNDIRREPLGSLDDVDWDTLLKEDLTEAERAELPVDNFARSTASMLAGLKMTYPDAHILILIPTWVETDAGRGRDDAWVKANVKAFGDLYIEVCERFDIDYVDIREMCSYEERSEYLGDNLHPNIKGMQTIFEMLKEYYDAYALECVEK